MKLCFAALFVGWNFYLKAGLLVSVWCGANDEWG
ncbi:hypothetical protein C621_0210200 [Bacillus thuringiensis serovar aizawai str. Leapi01]|nr:hypothetical protein C621_0210200 [Bacillus thuringiensis serovar aizawai str. Leapi01]ETE97487.1 hypothetical protein C623_0214325 [Bacillus thuringiensis serovar aizawai str. Hu4-2]